MNTTNEDNNFDYEIDVVLNVFKRQSLLQEQVDAIYNQSIRPSRIWIWVNGSELNDLIYPNDIEVIVTKCSVNLGVWSRFIYGLNSNAKYIAFFDDDTIPGIKWFENCINNIDNKTILGTRGLVFASHNSYSPNNEFGWNNPNQKLKHVDIVGHAWFFTREVLDIFFMEYSNRHMDYLSGEDIHLSFSLQKHGGKTIVPPHPMNNPELWGSRKETALKIGSDENSISLIHGAEEKFTKALNHYIEKGFSLICFNSLAPSIIIKNNLRNNQRFMAYFDKRPRLKYVIVRFKKCLKKIGIHM